MNLVGRAPRRRRLLGRCLGCLLVATSSLPALADNPIASSNFAGTEDPLFENGAWAPIVSMAPEGTRFLKNNGAAYCDRFLGPHSNHAGARTTAAIPEDHYSEIVVGHVANNLSYVGAFVRAQTSGPELDSHYLWWGSLAGGANNFLYRIQADGTTYHPSTILQHSTIADGDRLRLIARGPVLYGIKNGVREFIYNTGQDTLRWSGGTAGILAYVPSPSLTDATITSWSAGAAPASSGTWASSSFAGAEDPLDEGDRWYPLPSYSGFKKAGVAIGKDGGHNASGAWSIAPPPRQYSEVTLGTVATGGGGPIVRIDRKATGQTGWLLFLWADQPTQSALFKVNPDGSFTAALQFAATILPGDKWRLTADGNTLEVSRNGVSQFTFTTDGSYASGDVGIWTLTPAFTLTAWEGGDLAGPVPTIAGFAPASGPVGTSVSISGTNLGGATAVTFNGTSASFTVSSATAIQATVPAGATTGPISVTTPAGTAVSSNAFTVVPPPSISGFAPASGPAGTKVSISGTSFSGTTAVTFNGVSASFTATSDTTIQATAPAGAATGPIAVTTPAGTATSSGAFTVVPPPAISGFAPASGPVGTSVNISGSSFSGATAVTFNGVSASFTVSSDTAIQTTAPAGATTGPIAVTTPAGTATSGSAFTVIPPPAISGFAPASGPVGTAVSISGTGFTGATAVTFNGASATFTVTSDTSIQAIVPLGATSGRLTVTTPGGTSTSAGSFTVTALLTLSKGGAGAVTSTSNPASGSQIDCGATCSASYPTGTVVTLTATAAAGSVLTGWTGCDSASGPTCSVTMSAARTVTATFAVQKFTLTVSKSGTVGLGGGTVTSTSSPSSSSQINCGSTCSVAYVSGTVVTLQLTPGLLSVFTGWTGCDSASGTTCTVNMNRARSVTARFLL